MHLAFALPGTAVAMQWVPLLLTAVHAWGLRRAQVHRVVMGQAAILAVAMGTEAVAGKRKRSLSWPSA